VLEELHRVELRREFRKRRPARRFERREPLVILGAVGDVLATSRLATAAEDDRRRHARELRRDVDGPPLLAHFLEREVEAAQTIPKGHQPRVGSALPGCSTHMSRYTRGIAARIGIRQTGQRIWYPSVECRYGRARSIARPATGAPRRRPRPLVVVARPETAPRCSCGMSLKSSPHA